MQIGFLGRFQYSESLLLDFSNRSNESIAIPLFPRSLVCVPSGTKHPPSEGTENPMVVAGRQWLGWCKELGEFRSCPFPAVFFLPQATVCVSTIHSAVQSFLTCTILFNFSCAFPGYLRTERSFLGAWIAGLTGWLQRHPPIHAKRDSLKWTPHLTPKRRSHGFQALPYCRSSAQRTCWLRGK